MNYLSSLPLLSPSKMSESYAIYTSSVPELAPHIASINACRELREIQGQCAVVREKYGISFNAEKKGLVSSKGIPEGESHPVAVYCGDVWMVTDPRKQEELLGKRPISREILDLRDFDPYTAVLTPYTDKEKDAVIGVTANPVDTSVPKESRAEFLNNSCSNANCCLKLKGPQPVPFLVAYTCGRRIEPGEELTIKYGGTFPRPLSDCRDLVERLRGQGDAAYVDECKCGACGSGFVMLGARPSGGGIRPSGGVYRPYQKRKREER